MAIALTVVGCGDSGEREATSLATDEHSGAAGLAADEVAFCAAWPEAMTSEDSAAAEAMLADPPAALEAAAALVREAEDTGSESAEVEAAGAEILNWIELHCPRGEPGASQRRVAPPIDASVEGLTFCSTTPFPPWEEDASSGMVVYGEGGVEDPYDGPMLAVLWNPADLGNHSGDGGGESVTVRGHSGVAAPITVFQQVILPELGTVIAWTEAGRSVGLYGRHWPMDRADELVAIADGLEEFDDGFRFPDEALPNGYQEVFSGSAAVTSLIWTSSSLYSARYEGSDGLLDVAGFQMDDEEFEAFRFFTVGVDQGEVADRDVLMGSAWHEDFPAVVTWREPDGLVVRIIGFGVSLDSAREVAGASRELTNTEWAALVEADDTCEGP